MTRAFLRFVLGRRRPSLRAVLGGIGDTLMSLQQTIDTIAADLALNSRITIQTAAVAAANAAAIKDQGALLTKLAADQGIDTRAADASLAGVAEALTPLLESTARAGTSLPGHDAAEAAGTAAANQDQPAEGAAEPGATGASGPAA